MKPEISVYPDLQPYEAIFSAMKEFTLRRDANTPDAWWFLEHHPVYTQGQAGKPEHLLNASGIPVVQSDRGGQITYHGPGQLVIYALCDLKRLNQGIKSFVHFMQTSVIQLLEKYGICGEPRCDAPGVYVQGAKICSLGLRVKRGHTYHGMSFNVAMDLTPFDNINPCGFQGMRMTQIRDFFPEVTLKDVIRDITPIFLSHFYEGVRTPMEACNAHNTE